MRRGDARAGDVILLDGFFPTEVRRLWCAEVTRFSHGPGGGYVLHFVIFKPGGAREPFERIRGLGQHAMRLAGAADLVIPDGPR